MGPDEMIEMIDHTLQDLAVGPDAMRWTSEPAPEPVTNRIMDDLGWSSVLIIFDEIQSWGEWGSTLSTPRGLNELA